MSDQDERIGFIGLGIMGRPMARNLMKAGYALTVWNRSRPGIDALVADGASEAESARAVAERSTVVITIVGDAPDVGQVALGERGILEGGHEGLVHIDMTTIAPTTERTIAERYAAAGIELLDAPVSGGEQGATDGTLSIMCGGKRAVFDRCRPVLEALVLAKKAGVEPATMLQAVSAGAASSWALQNLAPRILARDFSPGFTVRHQQKDLRHALDLARERSTPLPGTALVHQLFAALEAEGLGEEGTQALVKALEKLANTSLQL